MRGGIFSMAGYGFCVEIIANILPLALYLALFYIIFGYAGLHLPAPAGWEVDGDLEPCESFYVTYEVGGPEILWFIYYFIVVYKAVSRYYQRHAVSEWQRFLFGAVIYAAGLIVEWGYLQLYPCDLDYFRFLLSVPWVVNLLAVIIPFGVPLYLGRR